MAESDPDNIRTIPLRSDEDADKPIFSASTKSRKTKVAKGEGPSTQIDVSFQDLNVTVREGRGRKSLLKNVSGFCAAGTLLEAIANVTNKNIDITGEIYFNNKRLRSSDRRQILSFVAQESPLLGEYTVTETLWFAARLYFGYYQTPKEMIRAKIMHIIRSVGLESCEDVKVGNLFFRGLSGGQRKRLSIAIELISSPSVIVLDEPTTGLDSSAALSIIQCMGNLAKLGHTLIASIHQPSSKIWSSLNTIMLMSQGRCVYYGSAARSVAYFSEIGFHCPDSYNPADFFSAILSTDFVWEDARRKTPDELADIYDNSATRRIELGLNLESVNKGRQTIAGSKRSRISGKFTGAIAQLQRQATSDSTQSQQTRGYDNLDDDDASKTFFLNRSVKHSGFVSTTFTLLHRFLMSLYREPGMLGMRLLAYIGVGLLLGLVYFRAGVDYDTEAMLSRTSAVLGSVGFFSLLSISAVPFILDNRAVLYRERKNGTYLVSAYVLANAISLLPATLLLSLVASLFVVLMVQLSNFGYFFIGVWVQLYCAELLTQAVSCFFRRSESGVAAAFSVFGIVFLCSGFFVPVKEMNWVIRWVAYISPIRYAFRMFMRNEFEPIESTDSLQFPNGNAVMNYFDLNDGLVKSFWGDYGILLAFCVGYIFVIYLAILANKV